MVGVVEVAARGTRRGSGRWAVEGSGGGILVVDISKSFWLRQRSQTGPDSSAEWILLLLSHYCWLYGKDQKAENPGRDLFRHPV